MLTSNNFVLNKYTSLQMQQHLDTKFQKLNRRLDSILPMKIDVSLSLPITMNPSPIQNVSVPSSDTYKLFHQCSKQSTTITNSSKQKEPNCGMILEMFSSKKTRRQPTIFKLYQRLVLVAHTVPSPTNILTNSRVIQAP